MTLLIFLSVAMAYGASEEFLKGKLAQLSQDLKETANELKRETKSVKTASSDNSKNWDDWWDSLHPKLDRQIELVNELEMKLHQYSQVSQEVQIAEKASIWPCWWCFGACVLAVGAFFCGWRFGDGVLQGFIPAVCAIGGCVEWLCQRVRKACGREWRFAGEVLQGFVVPAVCAIRGGVEWLRQLLEWFCQQVRKKRGKAAAPNTEPFLDPNDKEQSPRNGASGCSHSESGDSHSSWDKI